MIIAHNDTLIPPNGDLDQTPIDLWTSDVWDIILR